MNMKKTLCIVTIAATIGLTTQSQETEQNSQSTDRERQIEERRALDSENRRLYIELVRRKANGLPSDKTKTPTSPDIIEHEWNFLIGGHFFEDKRIYFGVDESGKPCYLRIRQHTANNPEFGKVKAVIYHEPGKFSEETFENVGPVVQNGRFNRRLENSIGAGWFSSESKGGLWCPAQNVFIGGTRDTGKPTSDGTPIRNMCQEYEQSLQRPQPVSKFKK
jgi:hypothetical protein